MVWLVIVAIVAGASFGLAQQTAHRRAAAVIAQAEQSPEGGRERPAAIERRAEEAERAGDFAEAVRLRFHAGLLRLDARGLIEYRPSLGTAAVARRLHSPEFDRLAGRFDEIVYGGAGRHGRRRGGLAQRLGGGRKGGRVRLPASPGGRFAVWSVAVLGGVALLLVVVDRLTPTPTGPARPPTPPRRRAWAPTRSCSRRRATA